MARMMLWIAVAWPVPALIAGALGWKGIWGSGSALGDYLMPLPVAGGALHVMTLAGVTAVLLTQASWPGPLKGAARGLLLGVALAGVMLLFDFKRGRFDANPLGLFLLTDSVLAQLFVGLFGGRWPAGGREWGMSLLAAIALPAAGAAYVLNPPDPYRNTPFLSVNHRPGPAKTDRIFHIHARLPVASPEFRTKAAQFVAQWDPKYSLDDEDVAFFFFTDEQNGRRDDTGSAVATYCMYQDGTPPAWHEGPGNCFAHDTVMDRFLRTGSREQACEGAKFLSEGNTAWRFCKPPR